MTLENIGKWAFLIGVVVAIVAGLATGALDAFWRGVVLFLLLATGLVVGILNIGEKEAIALIGVQYVRLDVIPYAGIFLSSMVANVAAFVAPAALVVALKSVYTLARKPS